MISRGERLTYVIKQIHDLTLQFDASLASNNIAEAKRLKGEIESFLTNLRENYPEIDFKFNTRDELPAILKEIEAQYKEASEA